MELEIISTVCLQNVYLLNLSLKCREQVQPETGQQTAQPGWCCQALSRPDAGFPSEPARNIWRALVIF